MKEEHKQLIQNMYKAEILATRIKSLTIGQPFSINRLAHLLKTSLVDAEMQIKFISTFGLTEVSQENNFPLFKIVLESEKRIKAVEMAIIQMQAQHENIIDSMKMLLSLLSKKKEPVN